MFRLPQFYEIQKISNVPVLLQLIWEEPQEESFQVGAAAVEDRQSREGGEVAAEVVEDQAYCCRLSERWSSVLVVCSSRDFVQLSQNSVVG